MAEAPVACDLPVLPLASTRAAPDVHARRRAAPGNTLPGAAAGGVRTVLRLEGGAMLALAVAAYAQTGAGWLPFAVLFFAPDLSLLGYLAGPRAGAMLYNATHSAIGPLTAIGFGVLGAQPVALAAGLVWLAHVGFDRLCGFGLKYQDGFARTHLGRIGRPDPW
jgi:hypothetical protein